MAKHIVGTSRENCPVVAWLVGKDDCENRMSLWDELRADHVAQVPGAAEELIAQCDDGGPHEIIGSWLLTKIATGGDVICGSAALSAPSPEERKIAPGQSAMDRAFIQLNTLL